MSDAPPDPRVLARERLKVALRHMHGAEAKFWRAEADGQAVWAGLCMAEWQDAMREVDNALRGFVLS